MIGDGKIKYSVFQYLGTSEVKLEEFFEGLKRKGFKFNGSVSDFLDFRGMVASNREYLLRGASKELRKRWDDENNGEPDSIFPGVTYLLPNEGLLTSIQLMFGKDRFLEQGNFFAFWSDYQREILDDESYVPFDKLTAINEKGIYDEGGVFSPITVLRKNINLQIWVYIRALGTIVDISPWVVSASTSKSMDVGSFSIQLIPTATNVEEASTNSYGEIVESFSLYNKNRYLNDEWFTKYIQNNDIVFIRFEVLKREQGSIRELKESKANKLFKKSPSDLSTGKMWDMIGLVDTVSLAVNTESTDIVVGIQGRDFMKVFVEDGSYFFDLRMVQGSPERWFYGGDRNSGAFKRNWSNGEFYEIKGFGFIGIMEYVNFILNQLVNIGVAPDSLFASCKKDGTSYPDSGSEETNQPRGIWNIIKVCFDNQISNRVLPAKPLSKPEGTIMDLFNTVCQQPFVEFWGDTWGDEFDITIRQPPFTKSAIQGIYDHGDYIRISDSDLIQLNVSYDSRVYGWYRIVAQNSNIGSSRYTSLAFCPIVVLDDYVERFGNKRCIINDIYLLLESFEGEQAEGNLTSFSKSWINDLLFSIETTMYLPFTRKGTITINGDRRIKPGTFIVLGLTNEMYYVTAVSNSISFSSTVDRTTVLTVERGMKIPCIKGESGHKSYFDIVDIEGLRMAMYKGITDTNSSGSKATVNKDVFEYFLNREFLK